MDATVTHNPPQTIVVSGLPGAGKTAFINHICESNAGNTAVVVQAGEAGVACANIAGNGGGYLVIENKVTKIASLLYTGSACTRIAVIDCFNFIADYSDIEENAAYHGGRPVHVAGTRELLNALMQSAHVIVLNKADKVRAAQLTMIKFMAELINEQAVITQCSFGKIAETSIIFSQAQHA